MSTAGPRGTDDAPSTLRHLSVLSSSEDRMTLSDLPTDVIRIIMRMEEPETMESMRLISHRWNNFFPESIKERQVNSSLPALRLFNWSVYPQENAELHIQLQQNDVAFLGVDWTSSRKRVQRPMRDVAKLFRYGRKIENRVARLLHHCSSIEYLSLNMDITLYGGSALRIVRDAMEHLRVDNLTLSGLKRMDSESASIILDIIRKCKNTLKWLSLQDEGCSILMNNFKVVQLLLAEASTLIPRVDFVLMDRKLRYERSNWEEIHNKLGMGNSKILIFESYDSRTVRFEAIN